MRSITSLAMGLTILLAAAISHAQVAEKKVLTLDGALKVIAGAVAEAKAKNAPGGVIAVVDDGGNLMALQRLDGTFAAGANIAIGKARTSALFKKPTKVFEDIVNKGRTTMVALKRLGLRTAYAGRFGSDAEGQFGFQALKSEGVNIEFAASGWRPHGAGRSGHRGGRCERGGQRATGRGVSNRRRQRSQDNEGQRRWRPVR